MSDLATDVRLLAGETRKLALTVKQLTSRATRSERAIVIVVVSLVLDVLLTVGLGVTGYKVATIGDCQARQNEAFREALQARSVASGQQNAALEQQLRNQKTLFVALQTATTPAQRESAGEAYLRSLYDQVAAIAAFDRARIANPLPSQANCR